MDPLMRMVHDIEGATELVDGDVRPMLMRLLEDDEYMCRLSSGEQARIYLGMQLHNGLTPDFLAAQGWNLHRALTHLDEDGAAAFLNAAAWVLVGVG